MNILKVLKEEEKYDSNNLVDPCQGNNGDTTMGTLSESHEYFIEFRVLETLASYAITDEPQGFFKFLLGVINSLISSVNRKTASLLAHASVNASIREILKTIVAKQNEIQFELNEDGTYVPSPDFLKH